MKVRRSTIVNILKTIGEGEILLKLGVHKALPSILYAFFLCMLSIFLSYKVEQTMAVREKNKRKIETLKIYCAQKTCDFVSLDRISLVENMLENLGSDLEQPQRPAKRINR